MAAPALHVPSIVYHADWGSDAKKRWIAKATLNNGRYTAFAPEPVGDLADLIPSIRHQIGQNGCALIGFDFPIGIPAFYAHKVGICSFREMLSQFGNGEWAKFYDVCRETSQISLYQPVYPYNSGNEKGCRKKNHLFAGLAVSSMDDLMRQCERKTSDRNAAECLFWTLGPKTAGKGAIIGWRDVIALRDLLKPGNVVIAETYPAEYYRHFLTMPPRGFGKNNQGHRQVVGEAVEEWATNAGISVEELFRTQLFDGFGDRKGADDPFDAAVGLFGMLEVILGRRGSGEPADQIISKLEGWILGQISE
jgi:hypothetical protein